MKPSRLISSMIGILVLQSPCLSAATPVPVIVGPIESVGGDQSFCPSTVLQQALVRTLSDNPAYSVQVALPQLNQVGIQVSGQANCTLGQRQRQRGFLVFRQYSIVTTATVQLTLRLIDRSSGATIVTIAEQGVAQSETQAAPELALAAETSPEAELLFEQATAQALNAVLPQVDAALD
jgi:hypothetical protein